MYPMGGARSYWVQNICVLADESCGRYMKPRRGEEERDAENVPYHTGERP